MSQTFHIELYRIWQSAVDLYMSGDSTPDTIVREQDLSLLSGWGLNRMDVFDFAEDWCLHQEPDFSTFLLVHYQRWRFFVEKQKMDRGLRKQERDATRWRRVRHGLWRCGFCGQAGGGARA